MGFGKLILEGNAQVMVHATNEEGEILHSFSSWKFLFIMRECNFIAHSLARVAVTQDLFQVWIESFPNSGCNCVSANQGSLSLV